MTNIKPCRKCGKVPSDGYAASRIQRSDWICTTCANAVRNKWRSDYRLRKRKAQDFNATQGSIAAIEAQLEFVEIMDGRPRCPFCNLKMGPTRTYKNRGEKVKWECKPCNDIIISNGF